LSPVSVFSTATQSVGVFASPSGCPLVTQIMCVLRSTVSSTGFGAKALAAPAGAEGTPSYFFCPLIITWKGRAVEVIFHHRTSTPARQRGLFAESIFFSLHLGTVPVAQHASSSKRVLVPQERIPSFDSGISPREIVFLQLSTTLTTPFTSFPDAESAQSDIAHDPAPQHCLHLCPRKFCRCYLYYEEARYVVVLGHI
jgi:hypothetical protein